MRWQEGDDVLVSLAYEALPQIPETDLATITLEKLVVKADDAAVAEDGEGRSEIGHAGSLLRRRELACVYRAKRQPACCA